MELVGQAIRLAYESSCNLKMPKGKQRAPWWSRELQEQCAEARRTFNRADFTQNKQDWKAHANLQMCYKYSVLEAQKKGREDYCEEKESYTEAARLNRILVGKPGGWLEAVRPPNGEYAKSEEESLKLLLETHYTGIQEEK